MRGGFKLSPMRILYVTRIYPYRPAFGGDVAYSRGVIESLKDSCDLTVLATTNGEHPEGPFEENGIRWRLLPESRRPQALSVLTGMPNVMWRNATPVFHDALRVLLREPFDAVILDHIASAHALPQLSRWRDSHPQACLLYLSHEHERTTRLEKYATYTGRNPGRQAAMRLDGWKIGRWEDEVVRTVDIVSLINPNERVLFETNVGARRYITTLPGYDGVRRPSRRITDDTPMRIALLGGRGPIHKRNILRDWLDVCAGSMEKAGIEMDVIGDVEPEFRDMLAKRHPSIRFSGFVEDLDAHLQGARLGVVPDTVGRGVKVRLASYIFSRLPMAGIAGAIDGLPLRAGRDYVEAPDLPALAETCIRLARDVEQLNRLQESAFRACDGRFDWRTRGADIVEAIRDHQRRQSVEATLSQTAGVRREAPLLGRGLA